MLLLAKEMRKDPTPAEKALWQVLRAQRLGGYKFRRQRIIDQFIVDFCCHQQNLIVEIDGPIHVAQKELDTARDQRLADLGYTVLRFSNRAVLHNIESVRQQILDYCKS